MLWPMEIDRDVRNFTNLHGDLIATTALTGTGAASATVIPATSASTPATIVEETEFGIPRGGMTTSARYGWLGGKRRQTDTATGITLMGQRLYEPTLGRFLQTDPVPGGSANAYDYAGQDPINTYDLDGRCWTGFCWASSAAKATGRFVWKHRVDIAITVVALVPGLGELAIGARAGLGIYRMWRTVEAVGQVRRAFNVVRAAYRTSRFVARAGRTITKAGSWRGWGARAAGRWVALHTIRSAYGGDVPSIVDILLRAPH